MAALEGLPHPRVQLLLHARERNWARVAALHDRQLRVHPVGTWPQQTRAHSTNFSWEPQTRVEGVESRVETREHFEGLTRAHMRLGCYATSELY